MNTVSATMTARERVQRMFVREDHDRVPRHDGYWNETIARWSTQGLRGGMEGALRQLGNDMVGVGDSIPAPFPGQRVLVADNEQTQLMRDAWGATLRYWKHRSGTPEHLGWLCTDKRIWRSQIKPAMLSSATPIAAQTETWLARWREADRANQWRFFAAQESFELTRKLLGDEATMFAMMDDPEWIRDISRTCTDLVIRDLNAYLSYGGIAEGLWIYGDMAYNRGTMCSPDTYRALIWPDHCRLAEWAHRHGMHVIFHTDGDVNAVIDMYIEAGFDCLQPLEAKANMDVRRLCPAYGDRMAFFGNIDNVVLATNDHDRIEHEVRSKLEAGMATRGYAYHSDHSVPPQVDWGTYLFVIDLLDRFGRYP